MAHSPSVVDLLARLRALVPRRRRHLPEGVAPLVAEMLSACRLRAVEESPGRITLRFDEGGSRLRLTCIVDHSPPISLTAAEAAVAACLRDGRTLAQIANLRGVSVNTIKSQVRHLFRKLNVDSRVALVRRLDP